LGRSANGRRFVKVDGLVQFPQVCRTWTRRRILFGKRKKLDPTPGSLVGSRQFLLEASSLISRRFPGLPPAPPRLQPVQASSTAVSLKPPPAVYDDGSVRSIASLGSFPEPPSHFPIPPLTTSFSSNSAMNSPMNQHSSPVLQSDGPLQSRTSSDVSGSGSGPPIALSRVTESPLEDSATPALTDGSLSPEQSQDQPKTPLTRPTMDVKNEISATERPRSNSDDPRESKGAPSPAVTNAEPLRTSLSASASTSPLLPVSPTQYRQQVEPSPSINSRTSSSTGVSSTFRKGDYLDDREFGADSPAEPAQLRAKTLDSVPRRIEGSEATKGNGGVVAAIRDKYTRATGPASPPPRDLPRLPLSVATIATRYQSDNSNESATSSRWQTRSPTKEPHHSRDPGPSSPQPQQFPSIAPGRTETPSDELARRRQRIEELEELERRERALELRARERELEALERERAWTLRSGAGEGYGSDTSRPNRSLPPLRPRSQVLQQSQPLASSLASGRSYSTTSLLPPGPSGPATSAVQRGTKDAHMPDCPCPACTVARYAEKPLTARLRPPQEREKSKGGWMRRLSMPVVSNAFSSEAKKAGGIGGKGAVPKVLGSLGEANLSSVSLGRR